ncbi:MAG: molybdopterin molybdotransferase MoeA [Acidimicrobiales bacterium]
MLPLAEARSRVLSGRRALVPRPLALRDALGCVTAAPVVAREAVPPFANSAVDGYALRAADTASVPVSLAVVGSTMAGSYLDRPVGTGEAVRIMTGAPLPPGADAVCMVEWTTTSANGALVTLGRSARPGESIRHAGEDVVAGQEVFPSGTVLTPACLGVLAGIGETTVLAVPRPRVGVLSTGDELYDGPGPLPRGAIRDSNRLALLATVGQSGFDALDLGLVRDDERALKAALLDGAARCDALMTSGGVSVGDRDVVKAVLAELSGGSMRWMQVAVRPAKPFAFGEIGPGAVPVFGLPGNPVSAMVSFELYARPALRKMAGHEVLGRPQVLAVADEALARRSDGKLHLVRVVARYAPDGRVHVRSAGGQGSHQLHAMALANALALLPDGAGVARGDTVHTMLLDPGTAMPLDPSLPDALDVLGAGPASRASGGAP